MSNKIKAGDEGWFTPAGGNMDRIRAMVVKVWSDTCVNLHLQGYEGLNDPTSVLVIDPANKVDMPTGYYFEPDVVEMETFIQPKITGYRQLNPTEAALMNEVKAVAEQVGQLIEKLRKHPDVSRPAPTGDSLTPLDQRWISIGVTELQQGFMAVTRGIARPTTF